MMDTIFQRIKAICERRWYTEALLPSAFLGQTKLDARAEARYSSDFRLNALAEGIKQFLNNRTRGLKMLLEEQKPVQDQPSLFDP